MQKNAWKLCKRCFKIVMSIVKADYPLEIRSKYHSVGYNEKNLDVWMFTNSTEATLHYNLYRFGSKNEQK